MSSSGLHGLDGDGLVKHYDDTVAALLDKQIPLQTKSVAVDRATRGLMTNAG